MTTITESYNLAIMMYSSIKQLLDGANGAQLRAISAGAGIPLPTLIKIKYGQTKDPGIKTVEALARYFTLQRII